MGHMFETAKSDRERVANSFLFCIVLDNFNSNTAPVSPKITSLRANRLVLSNEPIECLSGV